MSDPVVGGGPRAACAARERRACECRSKDANWTGVELDMPDREKLRSLRIKLRGSYDEVPTKHDMFRGNVARRRRDETICS